MLYHQLANELWKLLGKKRTYIGFLVFLAAQNIMLLMFRSARAEGFMHRMLEGNGYEVDAFNSSLTYATGMIFPLAHFLVPIYAALVGGDLVAKEVEDGTLRMILSRPISRLRLLLLKWLCGSIFAGLLVLSLGAFGLIFASVWFPWRGLFVYVPYEIFGVFDASAGWHRYLSAHLLMIANAVTIVTTAFMFSCFNVKPAAATILALSLVFISTVVQEIPYFRELKHWLLTYHLNVWHVSFAERVSWARIGESLSLLMGINLSCLIIGCAVFQTRDIKS